MSQIQKATLDKNADRWIPSVRFPAQMKKRVEKAARKLGVTPTDFMRRAVEDRVENVEARP